MNPKTAKAIRKVTLIVLGTAYFYVGAATMLAGVATVAKQVRK